MSLGVKGKALKGIQTFTVNHRKQHKIINNKKFPSFLLVQHANARTSQFSMVQHN